MKAREASSHVEERILAEIADGGVEHEVNRAVDVLLEMNLSVPETREVMENAGSLGDVSKWSRTMLAISLFWWITNPNQVFLGRVMEVYSPQETPKSFRYALFTLVALESIAFLVLFFRMPPERKAFAEKTIWIILLFSELVYILILNPLILALSIAGPARVSRNPVGRRLVRLLFGRNPLATREVPRHQVQDPLEEKKPVHESPVDPIEAYDGKPKDPQGNSDAGLDASVNRLPANTSVVDEQLSLFADQAASWRLDALEAQQRLGALEQSSAQAQRETLEAHARVSQLEDRALLAEAAKSSCAEHVATLESQHSRERRLAFDSLERERRHSGKLQEKVKTLEEELELQKLVQQLEIKVTVHESEKKELEEEMRSKQEVMDAEEIKQQVTMRAASAKEAAAKELLEATRRHEEELQQREAVLEEILLGERGKQRETYGFGRPRITPQEGFVAEKERLLEDCRQQMQEERSELLNRVKAREERVSAQISKCQRKSEVELEKLGCLDLRRLALISAQEKSAQETLRQRQQIQEQAEEIHQLQQQLRKSESEHRLKDASDTKWRRQAVGHVANQSCVGERTIRSGSRSASLTNLTLLGQLTPSTCSSTPAGATRTKQKGQGPP
eukprot:s78_g50.t1